MLSRFAQSARIELIFDGCPNYSYNDTHGGIFLMIIKLPEISELTNQQKEILNETGSVAVYGGAGTGKTVLSIWKHILNWEERKIRSFLITYTHTLTRYFELSIQSKSLIASQYIENQDKFDNNPNIDMLIIDEAQDISQEKHLSFKSIYNQVSYGADDNQILYPETQTTQKELNDIYQTKKFDLFQNFRNSYEILIFIKELFPCSNISMDMIQYAEKRYKTYEKPLLIHSISQEKLNNYLIRLLNFLKVETKKIAILVPTLGMLDDYKKLLDSKHIEYSYYDNRQNGSIRNEEFESIHLTTFKSSKGLEFDIVIIPQLENALYFFRNGRVVKENDYYVGMTRAREQLFLLTDNKDIFQNKDSTLYEIEAI